MADKRKLRGEKTKNAILDAAIKMVEDQGLQEFSTRSIAERAGVSQSSLYHHFKSSDEIMLAVLSRIMDQVLSANRVENFDSVNQYLHHVFEQATTKVDTYGWSKGTFSLFEKAMFDDNLRGQLTSLVKIVINNVSDNVKRIFPNEIDPNKLEHVVTVFFFFVDGYRMHHALFRENSPFLNLKKEASWMISTLSNYLEEQSSKEESYFC